MSKRGLFPLLQGINLFFVFSLVLSLDQLTKYLAQAILPSSGSVAIIKGVFHLTLVQNRGAAFGLFKGGASIFIFISIACMFVIVLLLRDHNLLSKFIGLDAHDAILRFSLGLILGGACGNLIDRFRFAYVVDFLDFRVWPVFNVADSAITIGGILICYKMLVKNRSRA